MVENSPSKNSITFVLNMGSKDSIPLPTLHSRMESLRGKIVLSQRWVGVCCRTCLLNVPHKFWDKGMLTIVYMLNRSPMMVVKQKTLEEVWSG